MADIFPRRGCHEALSACRITGGWHRAENIDPVNTWCCLHVNGVEQFVEDCLLVDQGNIIVSVCEAKVEIATAQTTSNTTTVQADLVKCLDTTEGEIK